MPHQLLLVAGEASGDTHGAEMLQQLLELEPDVECFGLGGDRLAAAGADLVAHANEISVVGLTEAARVIGRARQIMDRLVAEVERRHCRTAVLIDSPDFNLRLARRLKERGVRVIYYVSPQLWAWRRGRVKSIARYVDRMLVLFGFEADFYREHGIEALHVGHPLVEQVPVLPQIWDREATEKEPETYRVALLPGSRSSEFGHLMPTLLESARLLAGRLPVEFRLIQARTIADDAVSQALAGYDDLAIRVIKDDRFTVIGDCHLALCASGTATLEVGLLGTPMIVVYRLSRWTAWLAKFLVMRMPYYSLANLVLEEQAVPELLQWQAEPDKIAQVAVDLVKDREAVDRMRGRLADLRPRLGEPGASRRVAEVVAPYLQAGAA